MVMIRWMAWRKEVEFRVFKKVFRIPDTVDLDMIKARFDDDDATLTITMPKRVKGISGFKIEEEEEEERVEFGDVSEAEHKEETEKKSFQIDEKDKIMERIDKEKELADSIKKSEDSSLRKPPDIEGRDSREQTRHEEQENNQQLVQAVSESDDFGSGAFEEIEEQEPDVLDRTSKGREMQKKMTNGDDSSRKVQGTEEPERHNEESKISETGGHEKEEVVKMEIRNKEAKEEVDGKMGEGFRPNIAETETKSEEFESDKLEADEVDKIHKLVDKNEDEGEKAKVGRQSEDKNLIKLKENEEQHSKGQKRHSKEENMKELVEEKTPEAETNILKPGQEIEVPEVDTLGKTGDERKEKQNIVKKETKSGEAKEETDAKMGEVFASNNTDTAMKSEDFESDKLESDEVDNTQKLVEKKDKQVENAKVGEQSEDSGSKLQEIGEQQIQGQKRHGKQEKIKELVDEQIPEAETNIENDILKPVLERSEGKHKIQKMFQEETKNQPETYKEKRTETGKKINEAGARKVQEIIRQQERDEPTRSEKESKSRESVKSETNDEEKEDKEIAGTERKEQESDRPKILREQEVAEGKTNFSKNGEVKEEEEIAEKEKEFGNDTDQRDSNATKRKEEKDMIQELVLEEKVCDGGKGIIAVAETKAENDKSKEVQEIEEKQLHKEDTCGKQFQKLKGGEVSGLGEVDDVENEKKTTALEKRIRDSTRVAQDIEKSDSDASGKYIKETTIQELGENRGIYRNENEEEKKKDKTDRPEKITVTIKQELVSLNNQLEQDNVEDGEKTQELVKEKIKDCEEEEGSEESKIKTEAELETERESSKKVQEIEKQKYEGLKRSMVQDKMEESEGKETTRAMKENDEDPELTKPYKRQKEDKIHELVEMGSNDYREKIKKQDEKDILRNQEDLDEFETQGEQSNIPKLVEEEKLENISELEGKMEDDNSRKFHEFEEQKSYEYWTHEKREKRKVLVKEEATDPKDDKHTGGEDHNDHKEEQQEEKVIAKAEELTTQEDSCKKVEEIEKQDHPELKRSMVQDNRQKTEEKDKTRAMEENEIVKRRKQTTDGSLGKLREGDDLELDKQKRHGEEDRIHELVEAEINDHRGKVKKKDGDNSLRSQETGKLDLGELEEAEESAAVVASNEKRNSKKVKQIEEESEKHKEQNQIPETSDHEVKEEYDERVAEKETKELEAHVQELKEKTENCKDNDGDGWIEEKEKQGRTVETKSDDGIVKKIQETKESNEKKNRERKESSNHVTEDGSLRHGPEFLEKESNVSKRGPVEQEKIQELKEVEKQDRVNQDEEKAAPKTKIDEHMKIRKPMEEKSNAPEKEKEGNEKIAEEEQRETEEMKRTAEPENESMASSQSQDIEGKGSDQAKRYAEQELMTDEDEKEEHYIREGEKNEKAKRILQVESKANDDSSEKNETEGHESTGMRWPRKENHQELVELETSDHKKGGKEEEAVGKAEIIEDEDDSSSKIHEHEERKSDKLERHGEEELSEKLSEAETSDDETSGKAKKNKNHETESRDDSSRKTQEIEKQERNEEQDKKNLRLILEKTNNCRNEEDGKEGKETAEAEVPRNLRGTEKRESSKMVERHEHQEGEDKKSMITQVLAKAKDDESKRPEGLGTHFCIEKENRPTELEDGSSKMIQERDKEESIKPERDENKIQEPVDMETSEDDEEEIEIEFEDEEEDWEAEVIQETDSNEDHDKIRQIKRIRLGFRLVGGSTLFMSLIVIVISIIRSKRKIRRYKF